MESSRDLMTDNHSSRSPERWRPSRVCSHRSTIWREDSVSCSLLSQFSRTPSRPSRRSLMSEEWERNEHHELLSFNLYKLKNEQGLGLNPQCVNVIIKNHDASQLHDLYLRFTLKI